MIRHIQISLPRFDILRHGLALALVIGLLAFAARHVEATDFSWNAPVSGSFLDPTNWNPNGVPGSTDRAIFDLGSAGYTVSLPANSPTAKVGQFVVNKDTLTLDPHQSQFTFAARIGSSSGDVANLTLVDGTVNSSTAMIGDSAGSTGTVTIDGSQGAAAWLANTSTIGNAGAGTLRLENGGTMTVLANTLGATSTGVGELDVSGVSPVTMTPSTYSGPLLVTKGTGTVNVTAGGLANFTTLSLATVAGSQATATVTGSGSTLNASTSFGLGSGGTGILNITGGGSATVTALNLATLAGSQATITVDGSGSALSVTNSLSLGQGTATLNITGGGQVSGSSLVTGTGQATLNISGAGSLLQMGVNALSGNTTINLSAAAEIKRARSVALAGFPSSTANVTLSGSGTSWTALDGFGFGSGTALVQTGAQLNVTGGTSIDSDGTNQMTVSGSGSQLNTDALNVATSRTANLLVEKGATASVTGATTMASNSGSSAQLTLDGAGTELTTAALVVGNAGNGTVVVKNGAIASVTGNTSVASGGAQGALTVSGAGSQFNAANLLFGGQGQLTINAAGTVNVGSLNLDAYSQTVNESVLVSGAGSQLNVSGDAYIATGSQGSFVANQGASVSITGGAGIGSSSLPGTVSLDGAGTTWQSGNLGVGFGAQGTMAITNAATADVGSLQMGENALATLTVSGSGSQVTADYAAIGVGAQANVSITAGAQATVDTTTILGNNSNGAGTLSVDGLGSSWTSSGRLTVGLNSPGIVNITGGATLSSAVGTDLNGLSGIIGENSGAAASSVTIAGAGSSWTQNGTLVVGQRAQGTMTIRDGGFVESAAGVIGLQGYRLPNMVTVSGAGSVWDVANSLSTVTASQLVVSAGGMVHVGQTLSGNGTIDLSHGGSVTVGSVPVQSGQFAALASVTSGTLQIEPNGTLKGGGTILGDVSIAATSLCRPLRSKAHTLKRPRDYCC
jgi:T5SS/PEP-CTERM-associated repeat protein